MRMVLVLIVGAALGLAAVLVVRSLTGDDPVTKGQIERTVAKRPTAGTVQTVFCNEEIIPSESPQRDPPHTWTCDTYLGPNKADAQNGPSYQVVVSHDRDHIESIRQVPTH